jgi:predicted metalloprotease
VLRRLLTATTAAVLVVAIGAGPAVATDQAKGSKGGGGNDPTLNPSGKHKTKRTEEYTSTVKLAIADIQAYWKKTFPRIYGAKYVPVPANRIIAARPGVVLPRCQGQRLAYKDAEGNAFYCFRSNFVVYDDAELFPQLFHDFGDFSIALVLAHEWGHAIQDRAGNADQPTVYKELQSDCFAGAWVAHVANGESKRLSLRAGNLDTGLAALIKFRDAPGSSPGNPGAHGDGFDRVSSFQDGFDNGPDKCATYFDSPPGITESSTFTTPENAASGGNLPADQVIPSMVEYLNQFYSNVEPSYQPLTIDDVKAYDSAGNPKKLPLCGNGRLTPKQVKDRVIFCIPDKYIGFDEPYLQHVYDDIGDFGVGTLFANAWAVYVQSLQHFPGVDTNEANAVFGADCYTGGFSRAMFDAGVLDPGDLDETIQAFIDSAAALGVNKGVDLTFARMRAVRDGFFNGYSACAKYATTSQSSG